MSDLNSQAKAENDVLQDLLTEVCAGSREAFSQLYRQMYTPLFRFLYRFTQSPESIEEIANDTMLVVWQKAHTFKGDSRVSTWIMGIAARRSYALQRKRPASTVSEETLWHEIQSDRDDIDRLNLAQALEWALGRLSMEQAATIELAYFHGFSCEEIAAILDCPVSTTKTRLHYARKHLHDVFTNAKEPLSFASLLGGAHEQ